MDIRGARHVPAVGAVAGALERLNARHPWSHNDHFHPWVLRRLPARRRLAVDVGCGQGLLASRLAAHFERVVGTDTDQGMRQLTSARCLHLPGVRVSSATLPEVVAEHGPADLVTMVAVLHHLDVEAALLEVREALAPGGRFLAVGLAPPVSPRDLAWDVASALTNPVIGMVKHPRPVRGRPTALPDPYPVAEPTMAFDELRAVLDQVLPGARLRHRLAFRHTIEWTAPPPDGPAV